MVFQSRDGAVSPEVLWMWSEMRSRKMWRCHSPLSFVDMTSEYGVYDPRSIVAKWKAFREMPQVWAVADLLSFTAFQCTGGSVDCFDASIQHLEAFLDQWHQGDLCATSCFSCGSSTERDMGYMSTWISLCPSLEPIARQLWGRNEVELASTAAFSGY